MQTASKRVEKKNKKEISYPSNNSPRRIQTMFSCLVNDKEFMLKMYIKRLHNIYKNKNSKNFKIQYSNVKIKIEI